MPKTLRKKKTIVAPPHGRVYIQATFNNTTITITDQKGNVLHWRTSGSQGFAGARKSTPFAAQVATKAALEHVKALGMKQADVYVSGVGSGREAAIRSFQGTLDIRLIKDITPIPHNGCRPKKPRRV